MVGISLVMHGDLMATTFPDSDLLVRGLLGAARGADLEDDLAQELAKALPYPRVLRLPREVALLQTVKHLVQRYATTIEALVANVARWVEGHLAEVEKSLVKAQELPLGAAHLEELRALITAHFKPAPGSAASWAIPVEIWNAWQVAGIIVPGLPLPDIADAFVAGRLYQVLASSTDYDTMKRLAASAPRSRELSLAEQWAQQHAAETIRGFGERLAARGVATALSTQQRIIREQTAQFLRGDLEEAGQPIRRWQEFARDLARTFRAEDAERDWHRVAVSETRLAYNAGRVQAMEEDGVEEVYYLVQPDACRHCKAVYLHPDGSPKRFALRTLLDTIVQTGGTNIGRLASQIGDPERGWLPNALLHPWCRCRPMPVLAGRAPLRVVR